MERHIVKVFGERNTGTRAVIAMLARLPHVTRRAAPRGPLPIDGRVEAAVLAGIKGEWKRYYLHALRDEAVALHARDDPWKHACPVLTDAMIAQRVRTLMMVRDPYSWLLALARRPYHMKGPPARSLVAFVERPWMTERREGVPAVLGSPLDLWSLKLQAAERFGIAATAAGVPFHVIRFEDFVQDSAAALAEGLRRIGVSPDGVRPLVRNTKRGDPDPATLAAHYSEERWKERLTQGLVARVNALVDWRVAALHGYAPLDPGDFPHSLPPALTRTIRAEMSSLSQRPAKAAQGHPPRSGTRPASDRKTGAAAAA